MADLGPRRRFTSGKGLRHAQEDERLERGVLEVTVEIARGMDGSTLLRDEVQFELFVKSKLDLAEILGT